MDRRSQGAGSVKSLAFGIIIQAISDWRGLCLALESSSGVRPRELQGCDFAELTRFFREDANVLLFGSSFTAERIYDRLLEEKIIAERNRAKKKASCRR